MKENLPVKGNMASIRLKPLLPIQRGRKKQDRRSSGLNVRHTGSLLERRQLFRDTFSAVKLGGSQHSSPVAFGTGISQYTI